MYENILFHGTEIERGQRMKKEQQMKLSRGDKHWLGDGAYFYEDDFYSYKWIKDMHIRKNQKNRFNKDDVLEQYCILECMIKTDKERVFNLDNPRHKIKYDIAYQKCKEQQKYSKRFSGKIMSEGVVLNILFNDIGYLEYYDAVIATFNRRKNKYSGKKMRLDFMPEKQICIKNIEVVKNIKTYECLDKVNDFEFYIKNLDRIDDESCLEKDKNVIMYRKRKTTNFDRYKYKGD